MNRVERFKKACLRNKLISLAVILATITIGIASFTEAVGRLANMFRREKPVVIAGPDVLVCIRSFSYAAQIQGVWRTAAGKVSIRLANKSDLPLTINKVTLDPVGISPSGYHGGLGTVVLRLDKTVPPHGVASVDDLPFAAESAVGATQWFDKPTGISVQAFWPGGQGPRLFCLPDKANGWICGKGDERGVGPESACD